MKVTVTRQDILSAGYLVGSGAIIAVGTDETGQRVAFSGPAGSLNDFLGEVLIEGVGLVLTEDWQVLGRVYDPEMTAELDRQAQDPPEYQPDEEPGDDWTGADQ